MKVVYFSHSDGKYGAPRSLMDLVLNLRQIYNIEPIIVTSKQNELNELCDKNGIENYSVYYADCMYGHEHRRGFIKRIHDIRVYWKMKWRHSHWNKKAIKTIENLIDFTTVDVIHTNVSVIDVGCIIADKYKIPHVWHIREYGSSDDYAYLPYIKNFCDYIKYHSDKIIFISDFVKKNWNKMGLSGDNAEVVYNAVQVSNNIRKEQNTETKILFSGSSTPAKGLIDLINAVIVLKNEKLPPYCVYVYGDYDNPYGKNLVDHIKKNDIEQYFRFCGFDNSLKEHICDFDIGVICSRSEAFGRVTVEYMKSGILPIASNTGANPELFGTQHKDLLYEFGNSEDLAGIMKNAICNPSERMNKINAVKSYAEEKFNSLESVKRIYNIYNEIL